MRHGLNESSASSARPSVTSPRPFPLLSQLQCLLFVSGFSALLLEIIYVKLLRYWAGNTAYAVAAVLAAYMAGLGGGSFAAGKWLVGWTNPLALYGGLELGVGLYSISLPWIMKLLEPAYLALTQSLGPETDRALLGHFLTAMTLLVFPTLLMGASFPIVVRAGSAGATDEPEAAEKLYASNLAGAALGTLLSDFVLIRKWGLGNTLFLAAALNAAVAVWAVLAGRGRRATAVLPAGPLVARPARGRSVILLVALAGGFLVLFQEIVWTHMVSRFLDNTVYGLALTLFAVIAGLGLAAALVARQVAERPASRLLPWACLAAGVVVTILLPFWDNAPVLAMRYPTQAVYGAIALLLAASLALVRQSKILATVMAIFPAALILMLICRSKNPAAIAFWIHHGTGFAVWVLFMALPAVLMGTLFPLALEWYLVETPGAARSVAPVYAANTLGSLAGVVVAAFLVLPQLGLERSGRAVGLALLGLGALLFEPRSKRRRAALLALVPAIAWALLVPLWDFSKTHAALNQTGRLVYLHEDLNGGVITVLQSPEATRLYSNGLIQAGNEYLIFDQVRCGLLPVLHAPGRDPGRAVVIGLGSGQTAGVVALFPFERVDLVDFSPGAVEAGRKFFEDINLGVYKQPRVKVHIADGRHYLLTHPEEVSVLTIEVTRLWVAGEGDLYTREFYELAAARLGGRGVLQQWLPLFRLPFEEMVIILRTVRAVFPQVAVYLGSESAMIVASHSPLQVDYGRLRAMDDDPQLKKVLATIKLPSVFSLLGDCVLIPEGVDALLARAPGRRISTDLWPHLEYSAARHYLEGMTLNSARRFFLTAQEFRTVPILGLDPGARPVVERWVFEERARQAAMLPKS